MMLTSPGDLRRCTLKPIRVQFVERQAAVRPIDSFQTLPGITRGKDPNFAFDPLLSTGCFGLGSDGCPEAAHNAQNRLPRTGIVIGSPTKDITIMTAMPATGMAETRPSSPTRRARTNPCPINNTATNATVRPSIAAISRNELCG